MDYNLSSLPDTTDWDLYTSETESIVYRWTDSNGWDTLYWFNAVPGDRAYPPGMELVPGNGFCGMYEVVDTAHVAFNGHALRQVSCAFLDQFGNVTTDGFSMIEKFGTGSMHFPEGGCFVIEAGWGLHTYVDDDLPLYDTGAGSNCDNFSAIAEEEQPMSVTAYPNPGTDMLHIEAGTAGKIDVRVLDATGRAVLTASGPSGSLELSSVGLCPGIYVVDVRTAEGRSSMRWIKQ